MNQSLPNFDSNRNSANASGNDSSDEDKWNPSREEIILVK